MVEIDEEGGERQEEKREHHLYVHPFSFYFFALYYLKLENVGVGCVVREVLICPDEGKGECEVSP